VTGRRPCALAAALALLGALAPEVPAACAQAPDDFADRRARMVEEQIRARGIQRPEVLSAMAEVPRHLFAPEADLATAYADRPLAIGYGQTVSQPYVVALMTSLADLDPGDRVLEIGTGSGYHTAVLSRVAGRVFSIEIIEPMAREAARRLARLGAHNVELRVGDGYQGWAEEGPFDAIVLTAAPPKIPQPLIDQLRIGGRMVVPVGGTIQDLQVLTRTAEGLEKRTVIPVRLQPMTGQVREDG
jgi:protein-L-isoaspartate(D-aspartate) O-methyltransferase